MNKSMKHYAETIPAVAKAAELRETLWLNDGKKSYADEIWEIGEEAVEDAERRLQRFAPYFEKVFPETAAWHGKIESPLKAIDSMKAFLNQEYQADITGRLYLKMDSHLPVAGSVKARGGIYEVLKYAESLALEAGMLKETDDYSIFAGEAFQKLFRQYTIQVGSTGNLGLSIGIMSAQLGFRVVVHMSADAKEWKKELLRSKGVNVVEYEEDYCVAVEKGRAEASKDPQSYFVDDENSVTLFLGYAVAGKRLKEQADAMNIRVDSDHPLFVYIPCGIGGAPGGIAYGLKQQFGDHVHCFFAEPTQACCMLLGMATGEQDKISVQDIGLSGKTEADGLAVGRPSAFVGRLMADKLSGIATIEDRKLYDLMRGLIKTEDIFIEPSACASFGVLIQPEAMKKYIVQNNLQDVMAASTHVVWATGGSLVPDDVVVDYIKK